jgi:ankyrin repeat protein
MAEQHFGGGRVGMVIWKLSMVLLGNKKLEVNLQDSENNTALVLACMNGHLEVVKALLTNDNLNVNLCPSDGRTALWWACQTRKALLANALPTNQNRGS